MASLSRGLFRLGSPMRPLFHPRPLVAELSSQSRFFTTSFRCRAASPSIKASQSIKTSRPPSSQPPKASPAAPQTSYALVKSLATKPTPTVLYEGPSHFWFYFGCWSSGVTILTWAGLTGPPIVFQQPEGIPVWVSWVYGSSYILLAAMGFYLISKTPNIVSSIRVLPAAAAPTAATTAATAPSLQMEVTVQRMLPFLKPKVLTTSLENVSLKSRFSLPTEYVPELRRKEIRRMEEKKKQEQQKRDMQHILTMPIRRLGRAFSNLFFGVKSAWTDVGYGVIKVDGKEYKVNVVKGFAHDGFRTLERIVPIKAK